MTAQAVVRKAPAAGHTNIINWGADPSPRAHRSPECPNSHAAIHDVSNRRATTHPSEVRVMKLTALDAQSGSCAPSMFNVPVVRDAFNASEEVQAVVVLVIAAPLANDLPNLPRPPLRSICIHL